MKSGLHLKGEVRSVVVEGDRVFFGVNNGALKSYGIKSGQKVK